MKAEKPAGLDCTEEEWSFALMRKSVPFGLAITLTPDEAQMQASDGYRRANHFLYRFWRARYSATVEDATNKTSEEIDREAIDRALQVAPVGRT